MISTFQPETALQVIPWRCVAERKYRVHAMIASKEFRISRHISPFPPYFYTFSTWALGKVLHTLQDPPGNQDDLKSNSLLPRYSRQGKVRLFFARALVSTCARVGPRRNERCASAKHHHHHHQHSCCCVIIIMASISVLSTKQ